LKEYTILTLNLKTIIKKWTIILENLLSKGAEEKKKENRTKLQKIQAIRISQAIITTTMKKEED